jgi:hypothetical protein
MTHQQNDRRAIWVRCKIALQELVRATDASPLEDPWQWAFEIEELIRLGMSRHDLRVLTTQGDLQSQLELQSEGTLLRTFTSASCWNNHTCFILTKQGREFAKSLDSWNGIKPTWNQQTRELRVAEELIKRYRCPASNQEIILAVFEEESWPARIDDPLPPAGHIDPKQRLRETIKSLNQNHIVRDRLRFRSDGNGLGIQWDLVTGSPTSPPS